MSNADHAATVAAAKVVVVAATQGNADAAKVVKAAASK